MITAPLRSTLRTVLLSAGVTALSSMSVAQTSTAELLSKANDQAQQINDVLRALQNADPNTQYALVKVLLDEKEPALVRIGREFALFSTNPVIQNMAISSVFNTNPQVRMTFSNPSSAEAFGWVEQMGGASDGSVAAVTLKTGEFNNTCWSITSDERCRFSVRGKSVQFNDSVNSRKAQADMTLGPDGVLRGPILMNTGRAEVSIDLKE